MTYQEIQKLVQGNNRSKIFSDDFVICLIWKESGFDPDAAATTTSATGLMQIETGAVTMTNANTPKGIHFEHSDMTDPAKNIQCGTYYLDIAQTKLNGIDTGYGTGKGYSNDIFQCEKCIKHEKKNFMNCLHKIHK